MVCVTNRRIKHRVATKEEVYSANVFIDEEVWRPDWWEAHESIPQPSLEP